MSTTRRDQSLSVVIEWLLPLLPARDVAALGTGARCLWTKALRERLRLEKLWHCFLAELLQQPSHYGRLSIVIQVLASGLRHKDAFWNSPFVLRCAAVADLSPRIACRRVYSVVNLVACCLALRHLQDQTLLTVLDHRGLHEERQALSAAPFGRLVRRETTERLWSRAFTVQDLPGSDEETASVTNLQVCVLRLRDPAFVHAASPNTLTLQPAHGRETILRELTVTGETRRVHVVVRNVRTLRKLAWHAKADSLSIFGTPLARAELSESVRSLAVAGCHWNPGTTLCVWSQNRQGLELTVEQAPYLVALRVRSTSGLLASLKLVDLPCLTTVEGWPLATAGVAVGSLCALNCQALRRFQHLLVLERLLLGHCPALASTANNPLSLGSRLASFTLIACPRIVWLGETWSPLHLSLQYAPGSPPVVLGKNEILHLVVQLPWGWEREIVGGCVEVGKLELRTSGETALRRTDLHVADELFVDLQAAPAALRRLRLPRLPPATTIRTDRRLDLDGCAGSPTLVRICTGKRCYHEWVPA